MMTPLFAFLTPGPMQLILLLAVGVLLFGRRLPEIGKYLGKGIVEFKKGLKGLEDEIDLTGSSPVRHEPAAFEPARPPQRIPTSAPKFEDPVASAPPTNVTSHPAPVEAPKF